LRLRNVVCLHASAVAVGDAAIAIVGSPGAGKSTTAAAFVKLGYQVLADDVLALQEHGDRLRALPGYPRVNLWPDAAEALYRDGGLLPRVTPGGGINDWWDKRYVDLDTTRQFQSEPLPLAAIYVLSGRGAEGEAPGIEPLSPLHAFMTLVEDTYGNYALDERMRAVEFEVLGLLVRTLPVRRVVAPLGAERLGDLCQAILRDMTCVGAGSVAD